MPERRASFEKPLIYRNFGLQRTCLLSIVPKSIRAFWRETVVVLTRRTRSYSVHTIYLIEMAIVKKSAVLWLILLPEAFGRTWEDVVDPEIFLAGAIDIGRLENALERDPFNFEPTSQPTASPSKILEESEENSPTESPTIISTPSPTARYEKVVGNGGCNVGKRLYEIRMADSVCH